MATKKKQPFDDNDFIMRAIMEDKNRPLTGQEMRKKKSTAKKTAKKK